ncbi:MAG: nicotinate-nucleotide--dimethylbenzimidazole phosphoribosyltransferase, partial [Chloroherpetonaceae bacterium]|nr:nicotinate-nucleotide--dimethylbenzimidazole phosphoribosyltransferase [Chloroherpetonaceae bacterium]
MRIQKLAQEKLNRKTKPLGSLGRLEDIAIQLCEIQQTLEPKITKKRTLVFAASHGIDEEGVSAYPREVTGQMVLNFLRGGAAINVFARCGNIELSVIDVGVDAGFGNGSDSPMFFNRKIRCGTRNFLKEPAMTFAEFSKAIEAGREQARLAKFANVSLLGVGEMGIGNTTSASALFSALLDLPAEETVGRGTGIDDERLARKVQVVKRALEKHRLDGADAAHWLSHVGGFEIVAMTGVLLEAADLRLPVVVDGFVSTAAAVAAIQLNPSVKEICFWAHCSNEKAHKQVLDILGATPILSLDMRLGEGTGAA